MSISAEIELGRAKNAVLSHFEQRLSVPRIYMDAIWSSQKVDVLAIDRDGVGDVHAVLLVPRTYHPDQSQAAEYEREIEKVQGAVRVIPSQYKYVGVVDVNSSVWNKATGVPASFQENSFALDGIGRVGFLSISLPLDGEPQVRVEIRPERFRARTENLADEYVAQNRADWELRA